MIGRIPRRLREESGRHALVDGIPFRLPVSCRRMQALMAAFPLDLDDARSLLPSDALRPVRTWDRGLLVVTVVNYEETVIGRYIEFSVAVACAHRDEDPPPLLPFVLRRHYRFGQYVVDLPVSTEISVKGGKGIWGMPKHQANLNFVVEDGRVSSQYDEDGKLGVYVEIERPSGPLLPLSMGASNYCAFRGMLMKSNVYFTGRAGLGFGRWANARVEFGDHPRVEPLKQLHLSKRPLFTIFFPDAHGVLDDYCETWFLGFDQPPEHAPEGFASVIDLGLSEEWLPPPSAPH